jgi:hypothetical protein
VNVALSEPATVTGPFGTGERMETASGEKNRKALLPSAVEKATESPATTGTECWLGVKTPELFVNVISVNAIGVTLDQIVAKVHYFFFFKAASILA